MSNLFLCRQSLLLVLFSTLFYAKSYNQHCSELLKGIISDHNIDLKTSSYNLNDNKLYQNVFDSLTLAYEYAGYNLEYEKQFRAINDQQNLLACDATILRYGKEQIFKFHFHRAVYNNNIGNIKAAEKQLNDLIKSVPDPTSATQEIYETYNYSLQQLAEIEVKRSNLNKAAFHLKRSIDLEKERKRDAIPSLASMQCRLAEVYDMLGDEKKALKYFKLANDYFIDVLHKLSDSQLKTYNYHYIGYLSKEIPVTLRTGNLARAKTLFAEIENVQSVNHIKNNWIYLLKSNYFQTIDQLDSSAFYLDLACDSIFSFPNNYNQKLSFFINLSNHQSAANLADEALLTIDNALKISNLIKGMSSQWSRNMIKAQTRKIELLYANGSMDESLAEIKKFTVEVNKKLSGSVVFEDHISHINDFYPIFELGLNIIFKNPSQANLKLAFDIIECTKAISLYKESSLASNTFSLKKDSLLLRYKTLSTMSTQLSLNHSGSDSSKELYDITSQLSEIKMALTQDIETSVDLNLIEFQQSLNEDELHVLSFAGSENYYFLQIYKDRSKLFQRGRSKLYGQVADYMKVITRMETSDFESVCMTLGRELEPIIRPSDNGHLVFSGDGIFSQIPLESILLSDGSFLLQHSNISYSPSAKIHFFLKQKSKRKNVTAAIFRPTFYDELPLDYAEEESLEILRMVGGDLFENEAALKQTYISECDKYDILHLATHAKSYSNQDSASYINFSDSKLYFEEIKSIVLNADLVYLSACETNTGQSFVGEGVQSLARNFIASGANAVVSSLWSISDQTTSEITISFYSYLSSGHSKSEALKKAKLDFIGAHPVEGIHPYYWAGLVLTGDDIALYSSSWVLWVCLFVGLLIGTLLLYKYIYPRRS